MRRTITAYLFLVPAIIGIILFRIVPVVNTFVGSLFRLDYARAGQSTFVGFQNYLDLLHDPIFWISLRITFVFNFLINPFQITISLIVALLVQQNKLINRLFRILYLLPIGMSITIASTTWGFLMAPNQGLINSMLKLLGIPPQPFLTSSKQALFCIILIASWYGISYWMLFFLAGLKDIPSEIYEAALIDGSNSWNTFWNITLPLLRRVLLFIVIVNTSANFLLFAPIYVLTSGGPQISTNTLMYETYASAFIHLDFPRSLTLTCILFILLLLIILVEQRLLEKHR